MDLKDYSKYMFGGIIVLVLYLIFRVISPFINAILSAVILSYVFYPLYKWYMKTTKKKETFSAILTILSILAILVIPIALTIGSVFQSVGGYLDTISDSLDGDFSNTDIAKQIYELTGFEISTTDILKGVSVNVYKFGNSVFSQFPKLILELFIIFFLTYYLLQKGTYLIQKAYFLVPLKFSLKNIFVNDLNDVTYAVVFGNIVTAMFQGLIAMVGYYIFGVKGAILWGLLTAFAALFPFIGTGMVWFPMSISKLIQHDWFNGFGLLLYGALIVGLIDNLLRPKLIGNRANIHPALVLLGVVGGVKIFGFVGIFLGPLLFALVNTFLKIYTEQEKLDKIKSKSKKTQKRTSKKKVKISSESVVV